MELQSQAPHYRYITCKMQISRQEWLNGLQGQAAAAYRLNTPYCDAGIADTLYCSVPLNQIQPVR
ncbi:hypothetical protein [Legionella septentrionalis]|uniref:hypothetical protein n=1 Tax=Legionella septentrionalis TaxID=2498109 RepID=UPI000F8C548F|nr:hypothetical protein [Legionella septentrionalis]RUR02798.1 hypothetical protein ELY11_00095 [Legionella septentrionalis]RUR11396.1 hypothetical protein ELY14_01205 [Legionella septentrionalis]RUR15129.1 hypothetical protein ELY10_06775 [Legionella septentrionalis]